MATNKIVRYGVASTDRSRDRLQPRDRGSEHGLDDKSMRYTELHCISCQRRGQRAKAEYHCQDCKIGMCKFCMEEHIRDITMNRHSVSTISKTFSVSPNQGPYPNLTEIGTIKLDKEISIRGSTFLPNGELVVTDYTNSKIRVFSADYTRKPIASMFVPREHVMDKERPRPLDLTDTSAHGVAFTANNGCVYIVQIGKSMIMNIQRIITVISFDSNYGECLGLAFNNADENLYVGCSSDREGVYIKIYGLNGDLKRTVHEGITEGPEYMTFGIDKSKLYAADSDSVTVYDVHDFNVIEQYPELQAQTRDIMVDKYGYLYTLALERRTFNAPGSMYRLNQNTGVTKVTALNERPSSMCYNAKTDAVCVTFESSRYIFMYKLALRTYQKPVGTELKKYKR